METKTAMRLCLPMGTVPPDIFRKKNGSLQRSFWRVAAVLLVVTGLLALAVYSG